LNDLIGRSNGGGCGNGKKQETTLPERCASVQREKEREIQGEEQRENRELQKVGGLSDKKSGNMERREDTSHGIIEPIGHRAAVSSRFGTAFHGV